MRTLLFLAILCCTSILFGQQSTLISGIVKDRIGQRSVENVILQIEGFPKTYSTDSNGNFNFRTSQKGEHLLIIVAEDYVAKRIPIFLSGEPIRLGEIFLEIDYDIEKTNNIVTLTENDVSNEDDIISGSSGLLQSTRDIFLTKAAFDFGQAFFRIRGYDSRNGVVMLNGIPMNKFFNGRPQWNNWGGLNDVTRNQEFSYALDSNPYVFGGILGNTNLDMRPSGLRPGTRISSSASNRSYTGRVMATYSSGVVKNSLAYTISASRRWANSGYVDGTLYDSYSFFGALEYQLNSENSIVLTSVLAKNRRGGSAALSEETFELVGNRYNPYWGRQNGRVRNSRERRIFEPIFLLNHYAEFEKWNWKTGIAYQSGTNARSRLGYYNAANPDPTYYRYLPSFYINSPIGADFINATLAKEGFLDNPQLNWESLYTANLNNGGKAAYLLYDDISRDNQISLSSIFDYKLSEKIKIGGGILYRTFSSENYAEIQDLLGAEYHEDIDTFSDTQNDLNGSLTKSQGETFNYHYNLLASEWEGFGQVKVDFNKINGYVSAALGNFKTQRDGLFQNERFTNNSLGKSEKVSFSNSRFKAGITYFLSGRHWFAGRAGLFNRPPPL
ncbi:MAG: hypothetical protein AB3N18_17155 [Allomuricauda sp.]